MHADPSIYKAYDIRGIVGRTIDETFAEHLGRAFGSEAVAAGEKAVAVGRNAAGVVAVELITAAQGVDYHAPLATSTALQSLHRDVRAISPHLEADRYWADEMAALQAAVLDGRMSGGFLLSA